MKNKDLIFKDLGIIPYSEAFELQNRILLKAVEAKKAGNTVDHTVLFCEHPHVYTIGKSGNDNNLLVNDDFLKSIRASYCRTDRGGDITYHGPGQIVVYPIIDLDSFGIGTKEYIYRLEYLIIELIGMYGIKGEISPGNIGVWLETGTQRERKICSIGVKVSRSITMHGLALNIYTDLSYFNHINPCGFTDKTVTSILNETGNAPEIDDIKNQIEKLFKTYFCLTGNDCIC
jgi:lipoyl(octanoyl) transferase